MTRKTNHIFKVVSSIALALVMCLSMVVTASAEDRIGTGESPSKPAQAALTKIFMVPVNNVVPAATFTFRIDAIGFGDTTNTTGMPSLGNSNNVTISFTAGQEATFTDNGTQYLVVQSNDILGHLPDTGMAWAAGAGIYRYKIHEELTAITKYAEPNTKEEEWPSKAVYQLDIYVEEDADGTLFARYIVARFIEGTKDEYYPGTTGDGKLDPTPGEIKPGTPPEIGINYSDMIFTNRYWKTNEPTNPEPDKSALEIGKIVAGGNPNNNKLYNFEVTVTKPHAAGNPYSEDPITYTAYKVNKEGKFIDANGDVITALDGNGFPSSATHAITLTSGEAKTVQLRHEERLLVYKLEVGAVVKVEEQVVSGTKIDYTHTFGSNANVKVSMPTGVPSNSWWGFSNTNGLIEGAALGDPGPHYTIKGIGSAGNVATFTNTVGGEPPTGLAVDDIPYVVLIGMAVLGIIGFLAVKSRKKVED